jgi:cytoskeletal protein CcmA (bactofilin family)
MANSNSTVIGRATVVRGRVSGSGDIEIAGRVEGDVVCSGEVIVDAGGLVAANISAARIIVRGAVKGDLTAEEALVVESGARVVGDLRAPRITIAVGGLVRGHVQTANAGAARPRAATAVAARASESTRAIAAPARVAAKAAPPAPASKSVMTNHKPARAVAGTRQGPPAPVVPVLKKGTKAMQKKRG